MTGILQSMKDLNTPLISATLRRTIDVFISCKTRFVKHLSIHIELQNSYAIILYEIMSKLQLSKYGACIADIALYFAPQCDAVQLITNAPVWR